VLQSSTDSAVKFCFHRLFSAEDIFYRVHKSHLARHFSFFLDVFPLLQHLVKRHPILQIDTTNELEGCSILGVHDAAEDVENLLTALYDGP